MTYLCLDDVTMQFCSLLCQFVYLSFIVLFFNLHIHMSTYMCTWYVHGCLVTVWQWKFSEVKLCSLFAYDGNSVTYMIVCMRAVMFCTLWVSQNRMGGWAGGKREGWGPAAAWFMGINAFGWESEEINYSRNHLCLKHGVSDRAAQAPCKCHFNYGLDFRPPKRRNQRAAYVIGGPTVCLERDGCSVNASILL